MELFAPPASGKLTPEEAASRVQQAARALKTELHKVIIGQEQMIEEMLICLCARGHCLMIGVPGLAKTLTVSTLARALHLKFNRIQFTPDLMPSDITGTEIIEEDSATGKRLFRFVRGPVFANVILADEINRTPPKTQAALLQAMQEYEVPCGTGSSPTSTPTPRGWTSIRCWRSSWRPCRSRPTARPAVPQLTIGSPVRPPQKSRSGHGPAPQTQAAPARRGRYIPCADYRRERGQPRPLTSDIRIGGTSNRESDRCPSA
jgi:hypothetical protein